MINIYLKHRYGSYYVSFARRTSASICSPNCKAYFRGLIIGLLCVGVALAVLLTIWLTGKRREKRIIS